jgi:tungstate transport system substrate-binding protein
VQALASAFNQTHDTTVCWRKAGSGESLDLLRNGEVDVILVHAPEAERVAVDQGWAVCRTLLGSNEFLLVGPKDDPADVSTATSVTDAFARIARGRATLVSRGDNSGTHQRELAIWDKTGIEPRGEWYVVTHDFMLETLKLADSRRAYFMTDSSTWAIAGKGLRNLVVLQRGDPLLLNIYHGLCQPENTTRDHTSARQFLEFVASEEGQKIVRLFGQAEYGACLYQDAEHTLQLSK